MEVAVGDRKKPFVTWMAVFEEILSFSDETLSFFDEDSFPRNPTFSLSFDCLKTMFHEFSSLRVLELTISIPATALGS